MRGGDEGNLNLSGLLAAVEAAPPVTAVDALARELARMVDATEVSLLVPNFSGSGLVRVTRTTSPTSAAAPNDPEAELPLEGSLHEEALALQEVRLERFEGGWRVLVPVTERGDAIGLLELSLRQGPENDVLDYLAAAAHALAYVLVATRRHTDLYEWARRDIPFSLAAEIQHRLLPSSYTVEGGPFTLAGWLEPAATVGGDTFDYTIDREFLYASLTDAVGHSNMAALLATLAVGSLRNTRRSAASPAEQADQANEALHIDASPDQFVTGHILRVRLEDGVAEIVNAGHPLPYLYRDGVATVVDIPPGAPLGVSHARYDAYRLDLHPGDRLLMLTDGFLERNAASLPIAELLERSADRHPREVVRGLARELLGATGGDLRDDAAALCIDWFGGGAARDAESGASTERATTQASLGPAPTSATGPGSG